MITLDGSLIWAIVIFLVVLAALDRILFRPLSQVQEERKKRTSGLMAQVRTELDYHLELFNQYQAKIKHCRTEAYRQQEKIRADALQKRAEALARARAYGERLIEESRASIRDQVEAAKARLEDEAGEMASGIAARILRRPA